jgi:hypothetical protein
LTFSPASRRATGRRQLPGKLDLAEDDLVDHTWNTGDDLAIAPIELAVKGVRT